MGDVVSFGFLFAFLRFWGFAGFGVLGSIPRGHQHLERRGVPIKYPLVARVPN